VPFDGADRVTFLKLRPKDPVARGYSSDNTIVPHPTSKRRLAGPRRA